MNSLTKLRIFLTIAAIAGLLPVTLIFIWGAFFFLAGAIGSLPEGWTMLPPVLGAISISVFCLWTNWKIYKISMSSAPKIQNKSILIVGVVATAIWGVIWAWIGQTIPNTMYIFLMPALTATVMLAVALKREGLIAKRVRTEK
ncbi:hypothetical protein HNP03_002540 [Pseudomonas rhodesiae]|uniref:hypothetical protein n=1 Tax=Pseudomonas rhodesiae TaxID=76760 RepID=UPI00160F7816|nr:hypothetical protein [Pseudomonas rhodesiae]MBB4813913.1 hypothetical protein [Pseudomonas rhodesiae]